MKASNAYERLREIIFNECGLADKSEMDATHLLYAKLKFGDFLTDARRDEEGPAVDPTDIDPNTGQLYDSSDYQCRFCCKWTGEFRSYCSRNCKIADEEGL